jgi:hypothetical protein
MPKVCILEKDETGEKNPLGVNVEFDIASLLRLELISDTNILFPKED